MGRSPELLAAIRFSSVTQPPGILPIGGSLGDVRHDERRAVGNPV